MRKEACTTRVLYLYLRELSAKISYGSVERLLDTPMKDSLRGISDALDQLHIAHGVYQLPPEYLKEVTSPFIAVLRNGRFCIAVITDEEHCTVISDEGKHTVVPLARFLTVWKGTVLLTEEFPVCYREPFYLWKQLGSYVYKFKHSLFISLLGLLPLSLYCDIQAEAIFCLLIWLGIVLSVCIIYKESYHSDFLQSFCKIGRAVDCNKVLHSKGATLNGNVSLGEMALLYYVFLYLYTLFRLPDYVSVWTYATIVATLFTWWSVGYQVFVVRKLCVLCLLLTAVIWAQAITLYFTNCYGFSLNVVSVGYVALVGTICCLGGFLQKDCLRAVRQTQRLKEQKTALLAYPGLFYPLLQKEEAVLDAKLDVTLHSEAVNSSHLQIVVCPHCAHCAKHFKEWVKLKMPVRWILTASPNDEQSREVALAIITCYMREGYQAAVNLLGLWYERGDRGFIARYQPNKEARSLWEAQQTYCENIQLPHTPFLTVNGKKIPKIYSLEDLRYVL